MQRFRSTPCAGSAIRSPRESELFRFRSVVSRIVALHIAAVVATSICMPLALFLALRHAVEQLHHQALRDQASEIAHYLSVSAAGTVRLDLPTVLAEFYSQGYGRAAYAVIDKDGRVLFSSLPGNRAIAPIHSLSDSAEFFQEDRVGAISSARPGAAAQSPSSMTAAAAPLFM